MSTTDLRRGLTEIAAEVSPVDLYQRALRRSAQLRRRRVVTAGLAAAVTVLAISGTTWHLAGGSAPAPLPPGQSATPSPTPTGAPRVTTPPVENPDALQTAAVLALPTWSSANPAHASCPSGELSFVEGRHEDPASGTVISLAQAGVTSVPETHHIGVFQCWAVDAAMNEPPIAVQVLAYQQLEDGLALVGPVVDPATWTEAGLSAVTATIDEASFDSISLDLSGAVGNPPVFGGLYQHRTYTWNGDRYVQSAGPGSFGAQVDVSLSVGWLVFAAPGVEFCRTGTITLTVTNYGSLALDDVRVGLILHGLGAGELAVRGCQADPAEYVQADDYAEVLVGPLSPGASRTVTATVFVDTRAVDAARFAGDGHLADVRVGSQRTGIELPIVIRY